MNRKRSVAVSSDRLVPRLVGRASRPSVQTRTPSAVLPLTGRHLPRETLFDILVRQLREEILSGGLRPGERLREQHLARDLGISRTPLREAFRHLEREGLVMIAPRQGASVSWLSANDAADLYRLRAHLSELAARLAATSIQEADLKKLRGLAREMVQAAARKDIQTFLDLYFNFHDTMTAATGSVWLLRSMNGFTLAIRRYGNITLRLPGVLDRSSKAHIALVEALERKEGELAGRIIRDLLEKNGAEATAHLETLGAYLRPDRGASRRLAR